MNAKNRVGYVEFSHRFNKFVDAQGSSVSLEAIHAYYNPMFSLWLGRFTSTAYELSYGQL